MTESLVDVVSVLVQARDLLLAQSQDTAGQGDWAKAKKLMQLAENADQVREEVEVLTKAGWVEQNQEGSEPSKDPGQEMPSRQVASREGFPKYTVRDGVLIKRGLQRDGSNVYEHAVPQDQYQQILDQLTVMASARGSQRHFSIEKVQKMIHCPRYMTYVVVSLLLREGLVIRARKGSYTFAVAATFAADAAGLWNQYQGADAS